MIARKYVEEVRRKLVLATSACHAPCVSRTNERLAASLISQQACGAKLLKMSTNKAGKKPPTLEELDALPPGIVGEIIEGVLYTMTKPRARHQRTTRMIGGRIGDPFDNGLGGPGGWWIVPEPGIELPNTPEIS